MSIRRAPCRRNHAYRKAAMFFAASTLYGRGEALAAEAPAPSPRTVPSEVERRRAIVVTGDARPHQHAQQPPARRARRAAVDQHHPARRSSNSSRPRRCATCCATSRGSAWRRARAAAARPATTSRCAGSARATTSSSTAFATSPATRATPSTSSRSKWSRDRPRRRPGAARPAATSTCSPSSPNCAALPAASVGVGAPGFLRATADLNIGENDLGVAGAAIRFNALHHNADTPGRDQVDTSAGALRRRLRSGSAASTRAILSLVLARAGQCPRLRHPVRARRRNIGLVEFAERPAPVDYDNYYGLLERDREKLRSNLVTFAIEHDVTDAVRISNTTRYGHATRDSIYSSPRFAQQ